VNYDKKSPVNRVSDSRAIFYLLYNFTQISDEQACGRHHYVVREKQVVRADLFGKGDKVAFPIAVVYLVDF